MTRPRGKSLAAEMVAKAAAVPDLVGLLNLAERICRLNSESATIGAGMLASLVDDARLALGRPKIEKTAYCLPVMVPAKHVFQGDHIVADDWAGNSDRLTRRRICPEQWVGTSVPWHPSHWRLSRTRTDQDGCKWEPYYGDIVFVCDDFGDLVEVPK